MSVPDVKGTRDAGRGTREGINSQALAPHPSPLTPHPSRKGLAPLEMVLALPILLFVMALIINYGTVASWKVRGLSAARHAVWSSRWPRSPSASPRPEYWPPAAEMGAEGAGDVPQLDDPRVDLPVARGPLPNGFVVHERLLDPTRGLRRGDSHLQRELPLLARMGAYDLNARHGFLDDKWQYQRTDWSEEGACLPENAWRRIPVIYRLPQVSPSLVIAYTTAAYAILEAPFRQALGPLETWRDAEFIEYALRFGCRVPRRDFHPRLQRFCSLDDELADGRVEDLIDRIQGKGHRAEPDWVPGVAWELTQGYIELYRRVIRELEARINAVPPPSPAEIAAMLAKITELDNKIAILEEFRTRLEESQTREDDEG